MTTKELKAFRAAYDKSVRKGKKGKDKNGDKIKEQTEWVWFDRKTLLDLLEFADEKTGGIKMYIGQYDKKNIDILPDRFPDKESVIGRVSLAMTPANWTEAGIIDVSTPPGEVSRSSIEQNNMILNGGFICPPFCSPPPPPPPTE